MLSKSFIFCLTAGIVVMAECASARDEGKVDPKKFPPASTKQGVTYAADIQPIFEKSCYPCHSAKTAKPKGKLRLDSLELVMKGGEDGPALVPGDSAKSAMMANITFQGDSDDYMPPPKNKANIKKLTDEQIGLIRAWIEQGAK